MYFSTCDHTHDLVCYRCKLFPAVLQEKKAVMEKVELPKQEKEELKFIVEQSKKSIKAWK